MPATTRSSSSSSGSTPATMRCSRRSSATTSSTAARPKRCATGCRAAHRGRNRRMEGAEGATRVSPRSARRRSPSARRCGRRCSTAPKKGTSAGRRRSYSSTTGARPVRSVAVFPAARVDRGGAPRLGPRGNRRARADGGAARAGQEVVRVHALVRRSSTSLRRETSSTRRRSEPSRSSRSTRAGTSLRLRRGPKFKDEPRRERSFRAGRGTRAQRGARTLAENLNRYPALRAILRRDLPRGDKSYLFIQGRRARGRRTTRRSSSPSCFATGCASARAAPSHKAIHNLLDEIEKASRPRRALKKCTAGEPDTRYDGKWIENEDDIAPFQDEECGCSRGRRGCSRGRGARRHARLPRDRRGGPDVTRGRARDGDVGARPRPRR